MSAAIELTGIQRANNAKAGKESVLQGLDLKIRKGELTVICDPSGCDKTGLFNILAFLDSPDDGSYQFFGKDVTKLDERARARLRNTHVAVMFNELTLLSDRTVLDNVALPLLYRALSATQRKAQALSALRLVALESTADELCVDFDRGMRQKIALARALVIDPELIIADDPSSLLDEGTAATVLRILCEQKSLGRTVILLTRDAMLEDQADAYYRLEDGILKQCGVVGEDTEDQILGDALSERRPTRQIEANIYKPVLEVGAQSLTVFDDPQVRETDTDSQKLPIAFSIEEALATDFVKEQWWKR